MFDLENITVKEFFQLEEKQAAKYLQLKAIMNPSQKFCKRKAVPLGQLSFGEVSELKRLIVEDTHHAVVGIFQTVFKLKEKEILNAEVVSFFYAANYINREVLSLIKKEYNALKQEQDPDLEMAGIKKLSIFGELSTLIGIAERYGNTPMEVEDWKYNMVFSLMLHDKVTKEIQKNYNEIKSNGPKGMV